MADVVSPEMMQALLKTYGAAPTPRNMAQASQFFASNPEAAQMRAMGARGGMNSSASDNTDLLGPMLDKLMAASDKDAPPGRVEVGDPVLDEKPAIPSIAKVSQQQTPKLGASKIDPDGVGNVPGMKVGSPPQQTSGGWMNDLLTALLGTSSVAGRAMMKPGGGGSEPPAMPGGEVSAMPGAYGDTPQVEGGPKPGQKRIGYTPKLEDNVSDLSRVPVNEPAPTEVTNSTELNAAGKKAQLEAEVDAENKSVSSMEQAQAKKLADQKNTAETMRAAKKAVGRR